MSFGEKKSDKDIVYFLTKEDVQNATGSTADSPSASLSTDATSTTNISNNATTADDEKGAFDPETGAINWDCPCLGGMAQGPCGEEFKASFSCFVFSQAEPKGADCVDKFRSMQKCFQDYPEFYADQLTDEEKKGTTTAATTTTTADTTPATTAATGSTSLDTASSVSPTPATI